MNDSVGGRVLRRLDLRSEVPKGARAILEVHLPQHILQGCLVLDTGEIWPGLRGRLVLLLLLLLLLLADGVYLCKIFQAILLLVLLG